MAIYDTVSIAKLLLSVLGNTTFNVVQVDTWSHWVSQLEGPFKGQLPRPHSPIPLSPLLNGCKDVRHTAVRSHISEAQGYPSLSRPPLARPSPPILQPHRQ